MKKYFKLALSIVFVILTFFLKPILEVLGYETEGSWELLYKYSHIMVIVGIAWLLIELLRMLKKIVLSKYDISKVDNLTSRKVITQINLLEKVVLFIIILFAIGMILLSFDNIREIGIGLFASAGVVSIIIGFSAQKMVGTLLAGIQIAITQPFRIDDAIVVEDEWGWVEEINLTYVVVRIWDKRRLVLPTTYFLEKPFQNWTRNSAEIVGSVFLYADYMVPFDDLRTELTRLLELSPLWDKEANVLQVTASKETTVEIRILVSARNSPDVWDLRVYIREGMITYIQKNFPESLPKTRVSLLK